MRRIWRLPFGERWLWDTPALSSSPGQAPTQEERCFGRRKTGCRGADFSSDLLCRIHSQTGHLGQVLDGILIVTETRR